MLRKKLWERVKKNEGRMITQRSSKGHLWTVAVKAAEVTRG